MENYEDNQAYLEATGKLTTKEWVKVGMAFTFVFGSIATLLTFVSIGF